MPAAVRWLTDQKCVGQSPANFLGQFFLFAVKDIS